MGETTVVFDTNVFISGVGFDGKPEECFRLALRGEVEMAISVEILHELVVAMGYDRLPITDEERHQFAGLLARTASTVEPTTDLDIVDDDPEDDKFLECATAADADYIVSGDDHLLDVQSFRGVEIVPPAEFLDSFEAP